MLEMISNKTYDGLFGGTGSVYVVKNGKPDYGSIEIGGRKYPVAGVSVYKMGDKLIESVKLKDGRILRGGELDLRNFK